MADNPATQPFDRASEACVRDARQLDDVEFCTRHGDAFLVHAASGPGDARLPAPPAPAADNPFDDVATTLNDEAADGSACTGFVVLPVRRKETSHFEFISVGRHGNNDVVIHDASVSKFHAIIKRDAAGQYSLFDGGSTNGTYVDGSAAPTTKDRVKPLPLSSGCNVRFGHCEFSFVLARDFRTLVKSGRIAS